MWKLAVLGGDCHNKGGYCIHLDKLGFIVGFGYTFRYKTNASLNRHSEALPKNLTPVDGAVEQRHYGFPLPPKIIVQ